MKHFVFSIRRDDLKDISGGTRKAFEIGLRTSFPSVDYMKGFAEGYGFGKIEVYTLQEYQEILNCIEHHYSYIYFVSVDDSSE